MGEALRGLGNYRKVANDIVIYDNDLDSHVNHVRQFLARYAEKGISLHKDKFKFGKTEITFAGFHLSQDGHKLDSSLLQAVSDFPLPSTITDLRSFFGLANQLSVNTAEVSQCLQPLRPLLSSKNDFIWCSNHTKAFKEARKRLSTVPTLAFYDLTRLTRLMTDACNTGLGFVLQQKNGDLIQTGSRFLSDPETRFATIEKEMLGATWAIKKCHKFLAGLPHFEIVTDDNPLLAILNNRRLDEIENPRLQRMKAKLMAYNFTARWQRGTLHHAADALSRNPVSDPAQSDEMAETSLQSLYKLAALSQRVDLNIKLKEVQEAALDDQVYQQLKSLILGGFPHSKAELPDVLKHFLQVRHDLAVDDD